MEKIVVYSGTRNTYSKIETSLKSLLLNTTIDKVYIIIEDDEISFHLPKNVKCINFSNQTWIKPDNPNLKPRWGGYMNFARLTLSKLFPWIDIILSLDFDTIVQEDIADLWDLNLDNCYIAAARDTKALNKNGLYINGGVVLYNLHNIRATGKDDEILKNCNTKIYKYPMQEALNDTFKGGVKVLPGDYNSNKHFMDYNPTSQKIIHYAGYEQYEKEALVQKYKKMQLGEEYY